MPKGFNERLQELIKRNRLTQKELAVKAGVTEAAMSHYIKGDRIPRARVMIRLADALGTSVDYLMNGTDSNSNDEIGYAKKLIARNASQMSKAEKMEIISILFNKD